MEFLGPGFEGLNSQAAAGILVERLKNAGDFGDRRDALDALLKLSEKHAADVGEAGMPIFADILQAGIADAAMTQTIMGIMINLVREKDGADTGTNASTFLAKVQNVQNLLDLMENQDALTAISSIQVLQALQNCAADALECRILECPAGLQALVEVLRDPREEVRNEVILLLGQLTSSNLEVKKFVAFQEGFERLFDIMSSEGMLEGGGVIVKDCIDICINLITGSPLTRALFCQSNCLKRFHELIDVRTAGLAKLAGFANTLTEGTDEAGHASSTVTAPDSQASKEHDMAMSAMQREIACRALDLLTQVLISSDEDGISNINGSIENTDNEKNKDKEGNFGKTERQSIVADTQAGLLAEMLAHVGFSRAEVFARSPKVCREKAMRATGALVDGHSANQYSMGELLIQDAGLDSVALATLVMEGALGEGGADPSLNNTYHWVLGCFFHGNELVCTQVVSHVIAPPPPPLELEDLESWAPPTPTGKVLVESMSTSAMVLFDGSGSAEYGGGKESAVVHAGQVMSRGCLILAMLFSHGGELTKEIALRVPLSSSPDTHPTTLLHALLRWLELATPATSIPTLNQLDTGVQVRAIANVAVSLLQLVCRWVHSCTVAARELLGNPANLFLLDVAGGRRLLVIGEGPKANATTAIQRTALKGLACVVLGLLLEYVEGEYEGEGVPRSAGGGGDDELTRDLVMKMIQNRVGMSPFMAAIEATKRAFGDADTAQRRRNRAAREKNGSGLDATATRGLCVSDGGLQIDSSLTPFLQSAAEKVRRRVISMLTYGNDGAGGPNGGVRPNPSSFRDESSPDADGVGAPAEVGLACLTSMVELQEREIVGLRGELSEALMRVPRTGGESALEETLRKQVGHLEAKVLAMSSESENLRGKLSEALDQAESEQARVGLLTSELQGLSVTVGSLERQLLDREAMCDGLRRELAAVEGGDRGQRESELARQVEEARARASEAGEALERLQRQAIVDNAAADAALEEATSIAEAAADAETKWMKKTAELQAALDEATAKVGASASAISGAGKALSPEAKLMNMSGGGEQANSAEELLSDLLESKATVDRLERALDKKDEEVDALKRETTFVREAAEATQASLRAERQRFQVAEARRAQDEERAAAEAMALRTQLDNAVRSLAEASSGGDRQIQALQKELAAVRQREERETSELRRRLEERNRQAKEESARIEQVLHQAEKRLNEYWERQVKDKEAFIIRLREEGRVSRQSVQAAASSSRTSSVRIGALEKEIERLREKAEHVDVLTARCVRLEEAALSAGAEAEHRLRLEMEHNKSLTRGAEGSVTALERLLEETRSEVDEKKAAVAELSTRLDQFQVLLAKSEEDREAAGEGEAAAVSQAVSEMRTMRQAVAAAEEKVKQVEADLEDRDNIIAAVEDARATQEREAERLRDKLRGLGILQPALAGEPNGDSGVSNGMSEGAGKGRDMTTVREDYCEEKEYLELLSEHEDLLQLLAQQEIVRKTLMQGLTEIAGKASARAVMEEAKATVTATYGDYVSYADDNVDVDHDYGHSSESATRSGAVTNQRRWI